jgi:hypothetical protein
LFLFAIFMHPKINEITIIKNYLRSTFTITLYTLMQRFPKRIKGINVTNSFVVADHLNALTFTNVKKMKGLPQYKSLVALNFSGCPLSPPACKNLGMYMIYSNNLRQLNVANCKL